VPQFLLDPSSKLLESTGLLRRKFLIDSKAKKLEALYNRLYLYPYFQNTAECVREGAMRCRISIYNNFCVAVRSA
jgi:hypothetical protein